jgi:putative spermidine/putrescine transport system ATP-binding protein
MDEPLSALDKKLREEIQFEIRRIHQQTEVTILYVTHDQEEALRLSDRIAVFSKGVIDQIGTGPELYAHPTTRFVAEFIGDSDFIACDLLAASGGKATVSLGQNIVFDQIPVHGEAAPGKKAALMLRPERLQLSRNRPGSYAGFQATVSDITFLGNNVHVVAHTGSGEPFAVRLPFGHEAISCLNRGDLVHLAFDPASAQVFC